MRYREREEGDGREGARERREGEERGKKWRVKGREGTRRARRGEERKEKAYFY